MTTTQGDDDTDSQTTKLVIDGTGISPSEASKMANEYAIIHNQSIRQEQTQKFQSKYTTREPILKPTLDRFVLHPIKYPDLWKMYKQAQASYWVVEELDLQFDQDDWEKLTAQEKKFIKHILAFFATADGIVMENLASNFSEEVQIPEAKAFYAFQMAIESVHAEAYSLLIDTYIKNKSEKLELFQAIKTLPSIKKKAEWMLTWCLPARASFPKRCIAFAIAEGVFFSGSFCAIFWLKKRSLMPGLCHSNELIARDEGLHCDFACLLYSKLLWKLTRSETLQILLPAVEIEKEFIEEALPSKLLDMNKELMYQYIEVCADRLLLTLGYSKHYHSVNPFEWMTTISLQGKTNFYEKKVGEYAKARVGQDPKNHVFDLNAAF